MMPTVDGETAIFKDNDGGIERITERFSSRRTRHSDVKHHILRDVADGSVVKSNHVKSREKNANFLIKAVDVKTFGRHQDLLLNLRT